MATRYNYAGSSWASTLDAKKGHMYAVQVPDTPWYATFVFSADDRVFTGVNVTFSIVEDGGELYLERLTIDDVISIEEDLPPFVAAGGTVATTTPEGVWALFFEDVRLVGTETFTPTLKDTLTVHDWVFHENSIVSVSSARTQSLPVAALNVDSYTITVRTDRPLTGATLSDYFTITNGEYFFQWDGVKHWINNNFEIPNATATMELTAKVPAKVAFTVSGYATPQSYSSGINVMLEPEGEITFYSPSGYYSEDMEYDMQTGGTITFRLQEPAAGKDSMLITGVIVTPTTPLDEMPQNQLIRYKRDRFTAFVAYTQSVNRVGPGLYTINAVSTVGRLTQMGHRGGIYNGTTAQSLIRDICGDVPCAVTYTFSGVRIYGWLPNVSPSGENGAQRGSARDNLMRVLFAIGGNVRVEGNGTLSIINLTQWPNFYLPASKMYAQGASVNVEPPVTSLTLVEHTYHTGGETRVLYEGTAVEDQVVSFSEPMSNLTATGFTIKSSGANYAILSAGTGTLTGQAYIHTTQELTHAVTEADTPNEIRIDDAWLVGQTNGYDVLSRLVEYYKHRTTISADVVSTAFEQPGDVVQIVNPYSGEEVIATIAELSAQYSAIVKARISALVGFVPYKIGRFTDVTRLLTGSDTFTVPAGVTYITVILIGGGQGGGGGMSGTGFVGKTETFPWQSTINGSYIPESQIKGQPGGAPGAGGSGGNVLRVGIEVTGGQTYEYNCGRGGTGSNGSSGAPGAAGGDTTFGAYTSADGSTMDGGYYDSTNRKTYGLPGANGVAGANGGDGGKAPSSYNSDGVDGADGFSASDGLITHAGGDGAAAYNYSRGYPVSPGVMAAFKCSGSGGGGASPGVDGGDAVPASGTYSPGEEPQTVTLSKPGDGANARDYTIAASNYGQGGKGGNGGGGAGGRGGTRIYVPFVARGGLTIVTPAANGGMGGKGQNGAPGCIILMYRKPA